MYRIGTLSTLYSRVLERRSDCDRSQCTFQRVL